MKGEQFQNKYRIDSSRLKGWDYSTPWYYFVTICAKNRGCIFGRIQNGKMILNEIGGTVYDEWVKTPEIRKEIDLDEFIIMPNHIHGIIIITERLAKFGNVCQIVVETNGRSSLQETNGRSPIVETNGRSSLQRMKPKSISSLVAGFKSSVAKRINQLRNTPGLPVWQSNYYDYIIRNEKSLYKIRQYIRYNPLKWEEDRNNPENLWL